MKITGLIKQLEEAYENYGDLLVTCTCNEIGGLSKKIETSCDYSSIFDEKETTFIEVFSFKIEGEE